MCKARWTLPLLVAAAAACGDADPFSSGDPSSVAVTGVQVSVGSASLELGDTTTAVATALGTTGQPLALVDFVWTMSDETVASLVPAQSTQTAAITALAVGTAQLSARVGGVSSPPVTITVAEPEAPDPGG